MSGVGLGVPCDCVLSTSTNVVATSSKSVNLRPGPILNPLYRYQHRDRYRHRYCTRKKIKHVRRDHHVRRSLCGATRDCRNHETPTARASNTFFDSTMATRERGRTAWARYQILLIEHPLRMQTLQAAVLALVGNLCNQCLLTQRDFDPMLVLEQVSVNVLIMAPATIWWLRLLQSWRLHWVTASLIDQLTFNVAANIVVFHFIALFFRGGLRLHPAIHINTAVLPNLRAYEPVWATRVRGFQTKLPSTLVREKLIPAHLKGAWELAVRFAWSIFIAAKLAAWR